MKMYGGKKNDATQSKNDDTNNKKPRKKMAKKKKKILITVILIVIVIAIVGVALALKFVKPPTAGNNRGAQPVNSDVVNTDTNGEPLKINDSARKEDLFNILICGTDLDGYHTDSIMLASFDMKAKTVKVLNIPRDTMANVKRSNKKINAAYSVTGEPGNIEELYSELESLIGFKPDNYVTVELKGFIDMIDAIGGVEVDVKRDMKYNDASQDLFIDLKKGVQTLNGYNSMCYMRYRKDNYGGGYVEGDTGRVRAQQLFVEALMKKMLTPATVVKLPQLVDIVMKNVKTDLSTGNMIWLGKELMSMNIDTGFQMFLVPGEGQYYKGIAYYIPYEHHLLKMVNDNFNPFVDPIEDLNIVDFEKMSGIVVGNG
ncbi:MAG: LCP family protein [Clostridia bacterium]